MSRSPVLEDLRHARLIANYANRIGIGHVPVQPRATSRHLGAVLADAILQAGVRYETVVRIRIDRIHFRFPEAAMLPGLMEVLERHGTADFLSWKHSIKNLRFESLTQLLASEGVGSTYELKVWLTLRTSRKHLLNVHGIGPKTCDYLGCLVGIDCIAVDRHVRTFASRAGVTISDYDQLKTVASYAADLLGMTRRDFDAWIWKTTSARGEAERQPSLF